jgi:hypothetical protein
MAYKIKFNDGEEEIIENAVRAETNGAGTYLYDADDNMIASYRDGEVKRCSQYTAPSE